MTGGYDPHDIGGFSNGMSPPPPQKKKKNLQFHSNGIRSLSFGTPLFNGHLHSADTKFGPGKNAHIVFVSVTFNEEIPLFRAKGHLFWVPRPRFNLHWEDTFTLKRHWPQSGLIPRLWYLEVLMTAFTNWAISLKLMLCTCVNSTYNVAIEISHKWWCFYIVFVG